MARTLNFYSFLKNKSIQWQISIKREDTISWSRVENETIKACVFQHSARINSQQSKPHMAGMFALTGNKTGTIGSVWAVDGAGHVIMGLIDWWLEMGQYVKPVASLCLLKNTLDMFISNFIDMLSETTCISICLI